MNKAKNSALVKAISKELGFSFCGVSKAAFLEHEAPRLEEWLKRGYQGKMSYLENHFEKRLDPTKLVPGAKSVVSLVYNYFPKQDYSSSDSYKVARYAYGEDYHFVIRDRLKDFLRKIKEAVGEVEGRVFVDSGPVHERAWATRSGLGWIGKNSLLLNREMGSFFFLAELILDLEMEADGPAKDFCGTCTACQDACPTGAIPEPYVVDGSRCISYLTIELKEAAAEGFAGKTGDWIFGCDICQEVCPWNRFAKPHSEPAFEPNGWEQLTKSDWEEMTIEVFEKVFKNSAVKRAGMSGLAKNISLTRVAPLEYQDGDGLPTDAIEST